MANELFCYEQAARRADERGVVGHCGRKRSLRPSAKQPGLVRDTESFASQRPIEGVLRVVKIPRNPRKNSWHQRLVKTAIHRP